MAKKKTVSKPKAVESKPAESKPAESQKPKVTKRKAITTPKRVVDGLKRTDHVIIEFTMDLPKQKINKGDQFSVGKANAESLVKLKRAKILS
tara:strand:- start:3292 stop:3567 length:276 start_codon:yes stop_codon:yes gene_type:complete